MENLKYLDTFSVQGFEIPSWNNIDKKECNKELLNPIEKFIFNNESANNEDAILQRKNLGELIDYIVKNS